MTEQEIKAALEDIEAATIRLQRRVLKLGEGMDKYAEDRTFAETAPVRKAYGNLSGSVGQVIGDTAALHVEAAKLSRQRFGK